MCKFHYSCSVIVIVSPLQILQNYHMFLEAVLVSDWIGKQKWEGFGAEEGEKEEKVKKLILAFHKLINCSTYSL